MTIAVIIFSTIEETVVLCVPSHVAITVIKLSTVKETVVFLITLRIAKQAYSQE